MEQVVGEMRIHTIKRQLLQTFDQQMNSIAREIFEQNLHGTKPDILSLVNYFAEKMIKGEISEDVPVQAKLKQEEDGTFWIIWCDDDGNELNVK